MNKGICFHFGYVYENLNIEQQIKDIKDAGFNCVIDTADPTFKHENGANRKRFKLLKKYGLKFSSLHMRYNKDELPYFWQDCKIGDKLEKNLIKDVKVAHKYGFTCVVVHIRGAWSEIGADRIKRILKYCEKYNVPLALENLNFNGKLLDKVFKTIKSDHLKFCYDVGHNHAFDPEVDYLTKYKNKVITLHLHDNLGKDVPVEKYKKIGYERLNNPDMHTLNKYGSIDWDEVALKLSKIKQPLNLDYEVLMCYRKNETAQEVFLEAMRTIYDGYQIAETDLKLRGPGDFLPSSGEQSVRQHGETKFRFASLGGDSELFKCAVEEARALAARDPRGTDERNRGKSTSGLYSA